MAKAKKAASTPAKKGSAQVSIGKDPKRVYSCGRIWDPQLGKLVFPKRR